ncbi:ESCRT-0 subunit protein hse1 [Linnemannia gamsii]|uniref:ESCRT-0 subunit protein hse1 n=1 Tax=Linnemannia gamsii TaxID=64522 RepID=A0ABQ7KJ98_9FUNG|nr:ESCRT-0 subunit protein hse1 [Linnemannia gamsii]
MAEAACSHILQSLQGHVIFLANQGLISDESRAIILGELCNLDLQAISALSINNSTNANNVNSNNNVQYASTKPLTTLQHELSTESRPSIDTELQMLVVPPKSAVVLTGQSTPSPPSSISNSNSNSNNAYLSIMNHQTAIGRQDSDSDEEDDLRDSDLAHQERLLRQEQNTDIITGELDNLVAASATDLEESEVGVLEGADEDDEDEDEETEVQLERSLSSPSQKPELPPLLFSNSNSYNSRPNSFDFSSAPLNNTAQERPLDDSNMSSGAVAPLTVVASEAADAAVPLSHPPPSQGSIHSTSSPAVTSPSIPPTVAPAQAKQDALSPSFKATSFSTTTTATTTTTGATTTSTTTTLPPPSANLERFEHHSSAEHRSFAPAHVSTVTPAPVPAPVPTPASTPAYPPVPVASSVAAAGPVHVNAPVTFQHTTPTSTDSVYSPSYSTPVQEQPTIYNPNQGVSSPAPIVYQPPALSQSKQSAPRHTPAVAEEHIIPPQGRHGHDHSYSRHLHDASASTAFSNDGKDSMTSLDSGKVSDQAPTPPPKEEYQKPVTYQPPASTQPILGGSQPTPVGPPSSLPDSTLAQPLAMPVQAYQLYQPKPYQPKSKPSVRQPPKQAQAQAHDAAAPSATVPPENQIQQQHQQQQPIQTPPQSQPQSQVQSQSQAQPQQQEQAQAPFQVQGHSQAPPVPGLAQQLPEQQQQQLFQQQYHLQQQYQAQQQMQQQQQQQLFFQQQQQQQQPWAGQHPPIHTGPEVSNVSSSGPPSATSSANESTAASKPAGKGWMSGIRTSFMPKASKKESKESKESKNQHAAHDNSSHTQVAPEPLTVQPQAPFGQQQHFEGRPGQYSNPPSQYGQQQHQQQHQQQQPGSSAPPAATVAPAHVVAPGRQDSFQSEASAQVATPQFQQQPGFQQQFQHQQQFQQQQQYQQQQQQAQQQQFQQQQPPTSVAPAIPTPAAAVSASQNAQANDNKAMRRLSSVSNSSLNNASLRPEAIDSANAASAAIQAARLSTSGASLPGQIKEESPVASPYQLQQQQQQQQPMVAQQEQRQQAPGSPLSDAGSRMSVQSGASEVRNLEVIARAQAMFDFPGEDPGDLPFKVGDIINVIEFLNDDWWRGTLRKELGIFPTAYVQKLNAPANGTYPKIAVTVRQSIAPSPTEQAGIASSLQQQASFRASYQPSSLEPATPSTSATAPIPTPASAAAPGPDAHTPGGNASFPAPPPTSSAFPAPPPGSSVMSPTASSVFTYFPNSGNQPPISPPPSLRNQNQRLSLAQGQPGQESPMNYGPPGSQPLSPISPQQNRFSQQPQPNMMQFQQQPGQPGQQQQQYQQYAQQQYQYNQQQQQQQQQPLSPTAGGSTGGFSSQMTTAQMAASAKPKKKFGTKW